MVPMRQGTKNVPRIRVELQARSEDWRAQNIPVRTEMVESFS